jgi:hypothetical protein
MGNAVPKMPDELKVGSFVEASSVSELVAQRQECTTKPETVVDVLIGVAGSDVADGVAQVEEGYRAVLAYD